jgi:hypothetical protein
LVSLPPTLQVALRGGEDYGGKDIFDSTEEDSATAIQSMERQKDAGKESIKMYVLQAETGNKIALHDECDATLQAVGRGKKVRERSC